MKYLPKRITLFAGHYGSGKTNIAVNFALHLAKEGYPVTIADLDIVNPYFRTKDSAKELAEAGVATEEFEGHVAQTVSADMVKQADVVIGITARHAMELMMRFPESAAKIEALPMDIEDPFGGDLSVYRDCLSMLSYAIAMRFFGGEAT